MRVSSARSVAIIAAIVVPALLLAAGLGLIASLRSHDAERLDFELYRISSDILADYALELTVEVPEEVLGYLLFGGRGEVLLRGGVAEPGVRIERPNAYWRAANGTVIYHRQLSGAGAGGQTRRENGAGRQIVLWYDPGSLLRERLVRDSVLYGGLLLFCLLIMFAGLLLRRLVAAEQKLNEQERLALLGQAARTISHEIKNPLAAIGLHRQLLAAKITPLIAPQADSTGIRQHLQIMADEARRLQAIVANVDRFIHPNRARAQEIELNAWVAEFCRAFVGIPDQTVQAHIAATALWVRIDPGHLRSIVENLVRNAMESQQQSDEHSPVTVALLARSGNVELQVRDRGRGLDGKQMRAVFDPFYTTKPDGTGLGLSLARTLARQAGGVIRLTGRPDAGCTSVLVLPRATRSSG